MNEEIKEKLNKAINDRSIDLIKEMISSGDVKVIPHEVDIFCDSPYQMACSNGDVEILQILHETIKDEPTNAVQLGAFREAINAKERDVVIFFIENLDQSKINNEHWTYSLCRNEFYDLVEKYIKKGMLSKITNFNLVGRFITGNDFESFEFAMRNDISGIFDNRLLLDYAVNSFGDRDPRFIDYMIKNYNNGEPLTNEHIDEIKEVLPDSKHSYLKKNLLLGNREEQNNCDKDIGL